MKPTLRSFRTLFRKPICRIGTAFPLTLSLLFSISFLIQSCTTVDLYEKSVTIPAHSWDGGYRPEFNFTIKDTTTPYKIFLVLRHNEKYNFNNLFINLYVKGPGQDSTLKIQRDLLLATNEKGWLASGMDDIYEHRIQLAEQQLHSGEHHFTVEQIMRENPLKNVLNVGIRIEK